MEYLQLLIRKLFFFSPNFFSVLNLRRFILRSSKRRSSVKEIAEHIKPVVEMRLHNRELNKGKKHKFRVSTFLR